MHTPEEFKVWQDTGVDEHSPWSAYCVTPPVPQDGKGKRVVEASFDEPGTYVRRCRASDDVSLESKDLTVTVTR